MAVDVDLSQYCDVILLWNSVAMFLISFFTDYWEYRSYDYANLIPALRSLNETIVHDYERLHITTSVIVEFCLEKSCDAAIGEESDAFGNRKKSLTSIYRIYLFPEHGNLFKECNDLEDAFRYQLYQDHAIYQSRCYQYMLTRTPWHRFHQDFTIRAIETIILIFGSMSVSLSMAALFNGTLGAIRNHPKLMTAAGFCSAAKGFMYLCTIVLFTVKLQLVQRYYTNQRTASPQEVLVNSHRRQTLGWSYAAAIFSLILTAVSAYVFIVNSKVIRKRRARMKRRQRMEAALMSSCKQDVALALRAEMIVVTGDKEKNGSVC